MSLTQTYLEKCGGIIEKIAKQEDKIMQAAQWFSESILQDRVVHLFGSGHSRIMTEEMWPRYGSFPGFHPIVELSLTFHNQVVGANGQRQAMFLENVSGLAAKVLRNFALSNLDCALVVSSSGCNIVQIEMAEIFQSHGIKVVGMISAEHSDASSSNHPSGKKLSDFSDLILDTGAPIGDAMIKVDNLETPVSPGSTVGGVILTNTIKAEVADLLTKAGRPPKVLTASAIVGRETATELFEGAYDEHGRLVSKLYNHF